jgi:hypothetical protein
MDSLKNGFGLGIGAMIGIGAVVVMCICGMCVTCVGLAALGEQNAAPGSARLRATLPAVELPAPASAGGDDQAPAPASVGGDQAPAPASVGVGQDALAGNIRWKVLEAKDLGNKLQSDNEFMEPLETSGRFVQVRVEVENRGTEAAIFTDVNLVDNQGRKFEDNSDASIWFVDNKEHCILEQLNPNLPKVCTMIFELPAGATGLKFQAGDFSFTDNEVFVDLGL